MAEMIVPGTYITVRPEGLISAGRVATGIVGVIGTAASGPVGKPITLSGYANAREIFEVPDDFNRPEDGSNPLTLVRSLEHIFNNGASTVIAVRVAGENSQSNASFKVLDDNGHLVTILTAKTPGTWGNEIKLEIKKAEENCSIEDETFTESFDQLNYNRIVPSPQNRIRIFRNTTKRWQPLDIVYKQVIKDEVVVLNAENRYLLANKPIEEVDDINLIRVIKQDQTILEFVESGDGIFYGDGDKPSDSGEVRITLAGELLFEENLIPEIDKVIATYAVGHEDPIAGEVMVTVWNGNLDFANGETPQQSEGDKLVASYLIDKDNCVLVQLTSGATIEQYTIPDGKILTQLISKSSAITNAVADETHGGNIPRSDIDAYFGTGSNTPGSNGADAGEKEYAEGLEKLANKLVNIVVLAGQDAGTMRTVLSGHLNVTEQTDHERIGVIGASGSKLEDFLGHGLSDDRIILVAPGIENLDGSTLPPAYTAAAVAGLISSLAVQTSLTNKTLTIPGLTLDFNRGEQQQLIKHNVLALIKKRGYRVLKGITTSGEGTAFSNIPTRRIVDYAKYGVRSGANPYIGRLNNTRVRAALKATIDAFLTRMVEAEALTGYELEVTATRAQEIAGEVNVVMTLHPTFSIDFIKVTMTLK